MRVDLRDVARWMVLSTINEGGQLAEIVFDAKDGTPEHAVLVVCGQDLTAAFLRAAEGIKADLEAELMGLIQGPPAPT
jgi:hypothetical protein